MKDFRKLSRYNEVQSRITDTEMQKAIKQNCLSWLTENQPIVFAIQSVVFISRVKNNLKAEFKWVQGKRKAHKKFILVHSYPKSYIQSPETPRYLLCNQSQITNTPPKKWPWTPQVTHFLWHTIHKNQNTLWFCT